MSIRRRFQNNEQDLTFIFKPRGTGYKINIIDNQSENEITLDDLNSDAENYYIKQLQQFILDKLSNRTVLTA